MVLKLSVQGLSTGSGSPVFPQKPPQWLIEAELLQFFPSSQFDDCTSPPLILSVNRYLISSLGFFCCLFFVEIRFDTFSFQFLCFGLFNFSRSKGLDFSDFTSQLHTHFILAKISLNRFIGDCCSCNQCLQSHDKLEIKACHHYLINLKLSSFWPHSMPFHKPVSAVKTVR